MQDFDSLGRARKPVVVAAGFFDGLHRGHLKVISTTIRRGREIGGKAWVFTFDRHPRSVLNKASAPALLTSSEHKLRLLDNLGVDTCMLIPFTEEIAGINADEFGTMLCGKSGKLREIVVGKNWRYGYGGHGDVNMLNKKAGECDIKVRVIKGARMNGMLISSTRVRKATLAGDLKEAAAMLGRPFSVMGKVVKGHGIGKKLGFPTANISTVNEILPPTGVYAAYTRYKGKFNKSVLSLGKRPTFVKNSGTQPLCLEAHLIELKENMYGKEAELFFIERIRSQRKYGSSARLSRQIRDDTEKARKILERKNPERIALHI